ncbi:MAG: hypothetical protein K2J99_10260 [Lachnospiraceae bacterium]|nr:hypothetical protein [Lachnospiraceae bacterium]
MSVVLFAMNFKEEIFKTIQTMVDRAIANCKVDRTYRTVIKRIDKKGYIITDETGSERTVPCGIPNVELRPMQSVWVKEPMGRLKDLHICGVVENTSNSSRRR